MINRKEQPLLREVEKIDFIAPSHQKIGGDVDVFWMKEGAGEAFKLDLVFPAGTIQDEKLVAKITSDLLFSGTADKSAKMIHQEIDLLGGFVQTDVSAEESVVSIYGLVEHFIDLFRLVWEAIQGANFPESELAETLTFARKRFLISQEKVNVLARQKFMMQLFDGTPFGRITELHHFDEIKTNQLAQFHERFYKGKIKQVALIGNVSNKEFTDVIKTIESTVSSFTKVPHYSFDPKVEKVHIPKENTVQSALRIGRLLFNRTHPDYLSFAVLNTILGGYFGSRLMKTIREEKGYTYGIGSGVAQSEQLGYFFISTEVGKDVRENALKAIRIELEKLQTELVEKEELEMVRKYMLGQLLKNSDGPFAMMDQFLTVNRFGLNFSYYDRLIERIKVISPNDIRELARKYLSWEDMIVVSVG